IGYRATGKSSVGKQLASELSFRFVDSDTMICTAAGKSVKDIVAEEGWEGFRKRELNVLNDLAGQSKIVIATGGGAVLHPSVWPLLKKNSVVVWLTASEPLLVRRIQEDQDGSSGRPPLSILELEAEIRGVLAKRLPLYKCYGDITIDTSGLEPQDVVRKITGGLKQFGLLT
ncbi:MAG: shikimate kinase, partial [Thermodesulfobacteriota bacterium]